jgi:hypothetical protein
MNMGVHGQRQAAGQRREEREMRAISQSSSENNQRQAAGQRKEGRERESNLTVKL